MPADWQIRKRYGHGAARVVLCPISYSAPAHELTMLEGCRSVGPELLAGARSGVMFGAMLIAVVLFTALREHVDLSHTQLVVWSDPLSPPIEEPLPVVEPKPPVPVPIEPEPVIARVAKVAKTPPRPTPIPVKPKPPPVQIAKVEKPKPKPKAKPKARKPKIEMAALSKPLAAKTATQRRERVAALRPEQRKAMALSAPALNAPVTPELAPKRTARTQRVAPRDLGKSRVAPALAVASSPAAFSETSSSSTRRTANTFAGVRSSGKPRVNLAAPRAAAIAAIPADAPRGQRTHTVAASTTANRRSAKDFGVAPAALAPARPSPVLATSAPTRRGARAEATSASTRSSRGDASLRGVALGSLASCRSDREEDLLKQRVLAAVRNREACTSSAGTYRFVETKNLNAFSMFIDRGTALGASDRCVELTNALACLE